MNNLEIMSVVSGQIFVASENIGAGKTRKLHRAAHLLIVSVVFSHSTVLIFPDAKRTSVHHGVSLPLQLLLLLQGMV